MINESSDLKVLSKWALKEYLLTGNVGVVPTDTVPALAVVPYYSHLIWKLKRRPADKPLILMGAGMDNLLVHTDPRCHKDAKNFGTKYWPGPLTLVLPAKGDLVNSLNSLVDLANSLANANLHTGWWLAGIQRGHVCHISRF